MQYSLSLSLLLSPPLTRFFVIRLNGKLSTARQRRRMRNEAKIKLIYKWRKKINKNTKQKAKHFFIYPSRAVPFLRLPLHQQPPPAHVPGQSPAMALSGQPVAPFVKNQIHLCALALLFKFLRYFSKFSRPAVVVHLHVVVAVVVGVVVVATSGGILMENAAKVEEEMFKQTKPPWHREAV